MGVGNPLSKDHRQSTLHDVYPPVYMHHNKDATEDDQKGVLEPYSVAYVLWTWDVVVEGFEGVEREYNQSHVEPISCTQDKQ